MVNTKVNTINTEDKKYFYALGRRKSAIATVRLYEGNSESIFNNDSLKKLSDQSRFVLTMPLRSLGLDEKMYFTVKTQGGGVNAQIEAARLAIARAIIKFDPEFRKQLRTEGLLTRDSREVERKKTGLRKARKAPQYSKR